MVGFADVAMPLPEGWTIGDYRCGNPQSNTVAIQPSGDVPSCVAPSPEVSTIELDDLDGYLESMYGSTVTQAWTLDDGTPARIGYPRAEQPGYHVTVVVVPRLEVIAVGTSPEPGMLLDPLGAIQTRPDGLVSVPQLTGRTVADARGHLDEIGLHLLTRPDGSPSGGTVVTMIDPPPGALVPAGTAVEVGVQQSATVPQVEGLPVEEAVELLESIGLRAEIVEVTADAAAEGTVIDQGDSAGVVTQTPAVIRLEVAVPAAAPQ